MSAPTALNTALKASLSDPIKATLFITRLRKLIQIERTAISHLLLQEEKLGELILKSINVLNPYIEIMGSDNQTGLGDSTPYPYDIPPPIQSHKPILLSKFAELIDKQRELHGQMGGVTKLAQFKRNKLSRLLTVQSRIVKILNRK